MSQYDFGTIDPNTKSGTTLASDLNSFRTALHTSHSGSTAPSYITTGMLWVDSTSANLKIKMYDGAQSIDVAIIDATNNVARVAVDSAATSYITSTTAAQIKFVIASVDTATIRSTGLQFNIASPYIGDSSNNELLSFSTTASAVNQLNIANAATGTDPVISAIGNDTNIGITLTPKGTGGVSFPDGTAALPSIANTGDLNTGLFFPAADTVAITTAGLEAMRITSSGSVGIGAASPTTKLSIEGALNFSAVVATPAVGASIYAPSASQLAFGTASTERILISGAGVVTISNLAGTGTRTVTATSTGVLAAASDSRLKQEVPTASIAGLAEIMQLRPVAYKWLDDIENRGDEAAVELGFFADEAKDIIPSAAPMGNDGYYGFYDRAVIAALTKGMQEQQAIITALTARIAALEA
jgi:hypothetical protein